MCVFRPCDVKAPAMLKVPWLNTARESEQNTPCAVKRVTLYEDKKVTQEDLPHFNSLH